MVEAVGWSEHLQEAFTNAQRHLVSAKTIHMLLPTDQLWIVTDCSVKQHCIGAPMYAERQGKLLLCGHFSTRLHGHKPSLLPCEFEALAIARAIRHFGPYLVQSKYHLAVLTDSKPCIQAYEKLCCGQFLASPWLTSFLSTVWHFQASIQHLDGKAILLVRQSCLQTLLVTMAQNECTWHARFAHLYMSRKKLLYSELHWRKLSEDSLHSPIPATLQGRKSRKNAQTSDGHTHIPYMAPVHQSNLPISKTWRGTSKPPGWPYSYPLKPPSPSTMDCDCCSMTCPTCLTYSPPHQTRAPYQIPNASSGDPLFLCPRHGLG